MVAQEIFGLKNHIWNVGDGYASDGYRVIGQRCSIRVRSLVPNPAPATKYQGLAAMRALFVCVDCDQFVPSLCLAACASLRDDYVER